MFTALYKQQCKVQINTKLMAWKFMLKQLVASEQEQLVASLQAHIHLVLSEYALEM